MFLYHNVAFVFLSQRGGLFRALAKDDMMIRRSRMQSYRLASSCFLHANLPHLMINCYSLNGLGHTVEPWFGSRRTATIYAAAGIAGNVLSLRLGTSPLSVGASGCIFGLLGAWAAFLQANQAFFAARGVNVEASLRSLSQTVMLNVMIGLSPGSMIDNAGHVGGLMGGAAAAYLIGPRLKRNSYGLLMDEPWVRLPGGSRAPPAITSSKRRARRRGRRGNGFVAR